MREDYERDYAMARRRDGYLHEQAMYSQRVLGMPHYTSMPRFSNTLGVLNLDTNYMSPGNVMSTFGDWIANIWSNFARSSHVEHRLITSTDGPRTEVVLLDGRGQPIDPNRGQVTVEAPRLKGKSLL